jgi:hypothetical protein
MVPRSVNLLALLMRFQQGLAQPTADILRRLPRSGVRQAANLSSNALASFRSRVSSPSVNQPWMGASRSRACCRLPRSRHSRAMLTAARSSQDFSCCARATASARSKYAYAFVASGFGDSNTISPAIRWTSASHHLCLVVSIAVVASPMQRQASSSLPTSAKALAKDDNQ